ncbi:hypothetical protein ACJX0J_039469, partial [Zea mays]
MEALALFFHIDELVGFLLYSFLFHELGKKEKKSHRLTGFMLHKQHITGSLFYSNFKMQQENEDRKNELVKGLKDKQYHEKRNILATNIFYEIIENSCTKDNTITFLVLPSSFVITLIFFF